MSLDNGRAPVSGDGPDGSDLPVISLKSRRITAQLDTALPQPHAPLAVPVPALQPGFGGAVPAPQASFLVRHRWKLVVGSLAVAAAALVALAFVLRGPSADEKAAGTLVKSSTEAMQTVLRSAGQATNRPGLEFTGTGAQGTLTSLGQLNARVVNLKDDELRGPVTQLLQSQTAVVQGFARLGEMAKKRQRLKAWNDQIRQQIVTARSQVGNAWAAMAAAGIGRSGLADPTIEIDRAVAQVDGVVTRSLK